MKITVNGEETEIANEISVAELLTVRAVKMPDTVTVELNGSILARNSFDATIVRESDTIEFLYFMGGG